MREQAAGRGCYEAYFVVASDPRAGIAVWLRYAIDVSASGTVEPSVWGTFFNRGSLERAFAVRAVYPAAAIGRGADEDIRIGEASLGAAGCVGEVEAAGHSLRWRLAFADATPPTDAAQMVMPSFLRPVAALKRSSYTIARPMLHVSGALEVDGRPLELRGARGCQAHLAGARRYPQWAWAHCSEFDESADASLDLLSVQGPGGVWVPLYSFRFHGKVHRFAELPWIANSTSRLAAPAWHFSAADATLAVDGAVRGNLSEMVEVEYIDPDGTKRWCANTELAQVELKVRTRAFPGAPWRPQGTLRGAGGAGLEFCGLAPDSRVTRKMLTTTVPPAGNGGNFEASAAPADS